MSKEFTTLLNALLEAAERVGNLTEPGAAWKRGPHAWESYRQARQAVDHYVEKLELEREAGIQYARAEYERHCRRSEQGNKRLLKMNTKGDIF